MRRTNSICTCSCLPLLLLGALLFGALGCGDEEQGTGQMIASSESARLIVYPDPYAPAMAGTPNPIDNPNASASALAFEVEGEVRIELAVENFPPERVFGSHLHQRDCSDEKAGGHYQNVPPPMGSPANDPMFANPGNEAWLDFTTDAEGRGAVEVKVQWRPRAGEAKGIIFHHTATEQGGGAGARLACLPITGF